MLIILGSVCEVSLTLEPFPAAGLMVQPGKAGDPWSTGDQKSPYLSFHLKTFVLWKACPLLHFPTSVTMILQELKLHNKNPSIRHEKPSFELLARGAYRLSKHTAYYCCLWLISEVEGESLLLKTLCTSHTGLRGPWSGAGHSAPSLRSGNYSTRWHQEGFQRRESTNSPA